MTRSIFLIFSTSLLILLVLINIFAKGSFYESLFLLVNGSIFEPALIFSAALFLSSITAYFFKKDYFGVYIKKFFVWYFPVALVLAFLSPTSGYTMPHRYDVSVLFGVLMVLVTVVMVGYSYFKSRA